MNKQKDIEESELWVFPKKKHYNKAKQQLKMKYNKKAQAAMEFMMTYGWAILIVLIALSFVAYFTATGRAFFLPERCVISTSSGLHCDDFVAYPGVVILKIRNTYPDPVEIMNVSISEGALSCNLTMTITIPGGSTRTLAVAGGPTCFDLTKSGRKIKGDIKIIYRKEILPRTTTADLLVKVAEGAAYMCQKAQDNDLCGGLDVIFGVGYRSQCCSTEELCC